MYTVETRGGEQILVTFEDLQDAIIEAKQRLEDDPELGAVEVYEGERYVGQATAVPDAHWQSVTGWLWAGEKTTPPGPIPVRMTREEIMDVYRDDFGKRETMLRELDRGL